MKIFYTAAIISILSLTGCANKSTDYYTVNCSNKTVTPPSGEYSPNDLALIKGKINYICIRNMGLVTLTEKDLAEFK